ncbi:MAG TPA: hypothetical protein DHV84_06120 [Desulfotomaculum sp.]|nr:hypothetical protein [Desulfotomaculum sp.]
MTGAFKCPGCSTTTWGDLDFCPRCGEPLLIECPKCEKSWRFWENFIFCPNCGSKVEKKVVSQNKKVTPKIGRP